MLQAPYRKHALKIDEKLLQPGIGPKAKPSGNGKKDEVRQSKSVEGRQEGCRYTRTHGLRIIKLLKGVNKAKDRTQYAHGGRIAPRCLKKPRRVMEGLGFCLGGFQPHNPEASLTAPIHQGSET